VLKSLTSAIVGIGILVGVMLMVLKKGVWGAGLVLIVLCVLLYAVTFVSELVKMHGKKVQGRDRHP
jgi:Na+-transporting methylmalonyl-CoA/oxaloacetate decarboxylase gamma subunit